MDREDNLKIFLNGLIEPLKLGKYEDVLNSIIEFENKGIDYSSIKTTESYLKLIYTKSRVLERNEKHHDAIDVAKILIELSEEIQNKLVKFSGLVALAYPLWGIGNFKKSLNTILLAEDLLNNFSEKDRLSIMNEEATFWNVKGILDGYRGEHNNALQYIENSYELNKQLGHTYQIAIALNNFGFLYSGKGELDLAIDYFNKSLVILEEIKDTRLSALIHRNIGGIYRVKGEADKAIEHCQKSYESYLAIDSILEASESLSEFGYIYSTLGKYETAIDYLEKSLEIKRKFDNPYYMSRTLYFSILTYIEFEFIENKDKIGQLLTELELLTINNENKYVNLVFKVAKSMILKSGKRAKDKIQAQQILEELVNDDVIIGEVTIFAMIHLCELVIDELKHYGEEEVLREAITLIGRINKIAEEQGSYILIIESALLKSKLILLEGNYEECDNILIQALSLAEEKQLPLLVDKINMEIGSINNEIFKMEELLEKGRTIQERINNLRIDEYISATKKLVNSLKL
ncbi:MAG: tetratricopeptide repeat protein [Candidatus Heimdallarchaeota archaeon]|nr:tetratricopeptide repeat protein [Candidatus Heimdallarchaeota archaeon]